MGLLISILIKRVKPQNWQKCLLISILIMASIRDMGFRVHMPISCTCAGVSRRFFFFDVKGLGFAFADALSRGEAQLASRNGARSAFIPMTGGVFMQISRTVDMQKA